MCASVHGLSVRNGPATTHHNKAAIQRAEASAQRENAGWFSVAANLLSFSSSVPLPSATSSTSTSSSSSPDGGAGAGVATAGGAGTGLIRADGRMFPVSAPEGFDDELLRLDPQSQLQARNARRSAAAGNIDVHSFLHHHIAFMLSQSFTCSIAYFAFVDFKNHEDLELQPPGAARGGSAAAGANSNSSPSTPGGAGSSAASPRSAPARRPQR